MTIFTRLILRSKTVNKRAFALFVIVCFIPFTSFLPVSSFLPGFSKGVKKVIIDAGHGGHDPGCLGAGSQEKNIALAISLKLGKYIEENLEDVEVIYTRKTDKFVELHERAAIANKNNADLFICIHCNANDNKAAFGSETYVMGLHRTKDNLNVAKRENSTILMEDNYEKKYDGFDPNSAEANIIFTMFQSSFLDQSLSFASKVQGQFRERVGRNDRGVKQAGFLVLYKTAMPSVLIETGFLTNKMDEAFLLTPEGQDLMASAIYRAFKEYKNEVEGNKPKIAEEVENEKKPAEIKKEIPNPVVNIGELEHATENKNKEIEKKEPAPPTHVIEGIRFKVQFAASNHPIELHPENFKSLKGVGQYKAGGSYRYTLGEEKSMEAAKKRQEEVIAKGYKDAFIVAFKNGERISLSDALKELNQ